MPRAEETWGEGGGVRGTPCDQPVGSPGEEEAGCGAHRAVIVGVGRRLTRPREREVGCGARAPMHKTEGVSTSRQVGFMLPSRPHQDLQRTTLQALRRTHGCRKWLKLDLRRTHDGPKMAPRWPRDGPEMAPRGPCWDYVGNNVASLPRLRIHRKTQGFLWNT